MRRDGGSVFPARANTGDPNGPVGGLSANEIARALISMMARSTTCSNQRPDTLMRDRICRTEETSCNARPDHTFVPLPDPCTAEKASSVERHFEAEGLRGLEINHQLVLGRRLHRQIGPASRP